MREPKRIQRRHTKGWRMPEGAVYVGRPSKWGNPYRWPTYPSWGPFYLPDGDIDDDPRRISDDARRRWAVVDFRAALHPEFGWGLGGYPSRDEIRRELAGRDLVCWCPLDRPCHADVLLEIANGGVSS